MTRPVPLAARLLLGAAAALALCQAIAATGLCAGPLALLREAAQDPGLAGAGFAALLLAAAAARRKPFDAELGLTALALPVLLLTSRALDALSAGMHPVTAAAAAFALERPLGLPGFALGRALAHSPAAAMICALAWTAAPVLVALVLVRERRRDGSCDRTLLALAGLLAFSAAAHLLWPLAGPAAAFAEAFPAAPPDLPTAVALSSHHAQVPRSGIPSLDAAWMVLAALRLRREGKGARAAAWTGVALAFIYLLGSGREPLVALAAAVPLAVAAEAFFTWTAPTARRAAVAGCIALGIAWVGALAAARSGATGFTGALSGVLLAASALVPILLAVRLPRDAAPGRPTARRAEPRDPLAVALSCVFFLSGAAGLFYEVIFAKSLALTFGSTANASTAVLAIYMAGMALGSWIGGLLAARLGRTIAAYAVCELGIAAWCSLSPNLLQHLRSLYVTLAAGSEPGGGRTALQLGLGALALLPPTLLMGMTLPLLTRALLARRRTLGDSVGLLYGANTLGAAAGAVCAGYLALPHLGIVRTTFLAVLANVLAGLFGMLLVARAKAAAAAVVAPEPLAAPPPPADRRLGIAALVILAVGGAATFALETTQVHLLAVVAGNSAYAFSLMLFAFLIGLGAGSAAGRRVLARGGDLALQLGFAELLLAASLFATVYLWEALPAYFASFFGWPATASFGAREVVRFVVCVCTLLGPALCIGAAYPLAMEAVGRCWPDRRVQALGTAAALNTVGNVAGALIGGFWLLPRAGSLHTLHVLAGTAALLGILPVLALPARARWALAAGGAAVVALWIVQPRSFDWSAIATGSNVYFAPSSRGPVVDHAESLDGGVTSVHEAPGPSGVVRTLQTNGKFQGNDALRGEMLAQLGFAGDPLLHLSSRGNALNIGFGTGTTARILSDAGFARVDVADLSHDILRLADRWFRSVNRSVLERPGVRMHVADGRNFLLLSRDSYDLVSIEISSIWFAGAASLYNREFYQLVKSHLSERGVLQQWVQLHHISRRDVASVLETVRSEFPEVWLYVTGSQGVIIACPQSCPATPEALARIESTPALADTFREVELSPRELLRSLVLDPGGTDRFLAWAREDRQAPISTDDNLHLEYSTPRGNVWPEPAASRAVFAMLNRFSPRSASAQR